MSHLLLIYLLGACFQLSLISSETMPSPPRKPYKFICKSTLVSAIGHICKDLKRRKANIQKEPTLQTKPLLDILDSSGPRDVDALHVLLDFIPDFPQEMKTMLFDSQSLLRKSQHPKENMSFQKAIAVFAVFCCSADCAERAKEKVCKQ